MNRDIGYRDATRRDLLDLVDFQVAMARETESLELNRDTCARGVQAVLEDGRPRPCIVASG